MTDSTTAASPQAPQVDLASARLNPATHRHSPNQDQRPPGCEPDLIVIHGISLPPGQFGGRDIEALFCNRLDPQADPFYQEIADLRVSTHLLIRRDGGVVQFVPFNRRAWHAGVSRYRGRDRCNDFSIGIELEGCDDIPYEDSQYQQLSAVIQALLSAYPALSTTRIVGHSDIAPGRKTDPGTAFDWQKLNSLLAPS